MRHSTERILTTHLPGVGDRLQRHEHGARAEAITQQLAGRDRQPGLADPARPGQRRQPHPRGLHQPGHLVDGPLPPEQRRRAHRQPPRAPRARRRWRPARGPAASGGEPLAQQHRQVIAHQPAQLGGSPEMTVRGRALRPDAGQQLGQAGLAVRRWRLDVQQPGQVAGQLELLLQAGNPRARGRMPVSLPVQPDEHIALRQVLLVHLPRRVRPDPASNITGVSRSAEIARATARRSSASSPSVELTNTRSRRSGGPDTRVIPRPLARRPTPVSRHHASLQPATPASKSRTGTQNP
jgi:hypothetical protein